MDKLKHGIDRIEITDATMTGVVIEPTLINFFFQQLSIKDEQIVRQQEQIDHLKRLLENQRILTLKTQEKVEALENKEKHQLLS